jgi:tripartite-type tricarboxylate transporter receptor subunit TctC
MIRMFSFLVIAISFVMISPHCAFASDWPTKPIRIIVPFAAGAAADMLGRIFAEALSTALGQQFYIENRAGGASVIGTEAVAQSEPDGYTLMVSGMPTHVLGPAVNKSAGYDPIRDFTHIAYLGGPPNIIVVHPSLGVHNYQQFAQKARNEELHYVSPGLGT